jgi:hypothetical protein
VRVYPTFEVEKKKGGAKNSTLTLRQHYSSIDYWQRGTSPIEDIGSSHLKKPKILDEVD